MRYLIALIAVSTTASPLLSAADLFYGVEALSGYRSAYLYRGFDIADGLLEFQLEAEVAANKETIISFGTSLASESGGDFSQFDFYFDARYEINEWTLGAISSYRDFTGTDLESGFDLGLFGIYQWSDHLDSKISLHYDFGNEASYASVDTRWSLPLNDSTYSYLEGGMSWVDSYLDRSGLQDVFGKAGLTFNINEQVSASPYLAISIPFEKEESTSVYAGFWFAFLF